MHGRIPGKSKEKKMRVAITATGKTAESQIDQRFGRAKYFMIHDTETGEWTVIDNSQDYTAAHGAGIQSAQKIVDQNITAVITGNCGPKAYSVLNAAHVSIYQGFNGTVTDAVKALENGALTKADQSSVDSGFGSI